MLLISPAQLLSADGRSDRGDGSLLAHNVLTEALLNRKPPPLLQPPLKSLISKLVKHEDQQVWEHTTNTEQQLTTMHCA